MNSALRSIRTPRSCFAPHARYFAAVAPPKPPPMTMTRADGPGRGGGSIAQPGSSEAAAKALESSGNRVGQSVHGRLLSRLLREKYAASASICSSV